MHFLRSFSSSEWYTSKNVSSNSLFILNTNHVCKSQECCFTWVTNCHGKGEYHPYGPISAIGSTGPMWAKRRKFTLIGTIRCCTAWCWEWTRDIHCLRKRRNRQNTYKIILSFSNLHLPIYLNRRLPGRLCQMKNENDSLNSVLWTRFEILVIEYKQKLFNLFRLCMIDQLLNFHNLSQS